MWFTLYNTGNIGSITPAGLITEYPTGLGPTAGPYGIALGPDGNMWFTQLKANAIGVITPAGRSPSTHIPVIQPPQEVMA